MFPNLDDIVTDPMGTVGESYPTGDEQWEVKSLVLDDGSLKTVYAKPEKIEYNGKTYSIWRMEINSYITRKDINDHSVAYRIPDLKPLCEGFSYKDLETDSECKEG